MRRPMLIGLILALAAVFWPWTVGAQPPTVRLLGQHTFESRRTFQDTTIGGLSGLAYDAKRGVYYAVSDDRGENQPPRFYTLQIDLDESGITDVRFVGVTFLDGDAGTPGIQPIERGDSDMEDIQLLPDDTLLISSERDRENRPVGPALRAGRQPARRAADPGQVHAASPRPGRTAGRAWCGASATTSDSRG